MADATSTTPNTLLAALNKAGLTALSYLLGLVGLGDMLRGREEDSGTITASATYELDYQAAAIQSIRVVTSGTAASVGTYFPGDPTVTPLLPPGGASTAVGIASVGTDRRTITFPNTVTRVIVVYNPIKTPLSTTVAPEI